MISDSLLEGALKALLVLIVISALLLLTRKNVLSLFRSYALQSLLLAFIAVVLYVQERKIELLFTVVLTVISKVILIPFFLGRVQQKISIKRDAEFRYIKPVAAVILSTAIIVIIYAVFAPLLRILPVTEIFILGSVIGISMTFMGLIVCYSRKRVITKVIGYLTMENGVVLFGIFLIELPFLIEMFVIMDILMVVMITAIMSFGMNASVEEFHVHLKSLRQWFKEEDASK
ncbi:MAG: hydrogenase subunit [Thermoplasmata archaeon]|nr:hydrogenase subunit [Thermoplasmata archaeon]